MQTMEFVDLYPIKYRKCKETVSFPGEKGLVFSGL